MTKGPPDGRIVRVLFGRPSRLLRNQIAESLSVSWYARNVHHYAAGKGNANLLRRAGARHVTLVNQSPYVDLRYGRGRSKPYLLLQAIKDHGEILYLDFDCYEWKRPDSVMWRTLRRHSAFQSMRITYPVRHTIDLGGERRRLRITNKLCFATCAVYCRDLEWIERWLDVYDELARQYLIFFDGNNEAALMYSLERYLGIAEAIRKLSEWECPVVLINRRKATWKPIRRVYFVHKKHKYKGGQRDVR